MLKTDYLIVGSGAVGMIFADQLLTETNATMLIVDRHDMPGGHWNDAYPFVRLHQPSAYYGAGSRELGSNRIDQTGFNKGYCELASQAEIIAYFDGLMRERFLPSGRVQYFPMCDHLGDGRFVSRLSGSVQTVAFRKIVDATYFNTQVPSTHTPSFAVADGVRLVAPNALPRVAPGFERFVILGGGKTAMDAGVWLLQHGAKPGAIRWIVPRDSWLTNRDATQVGEAFLHKTLGGQMHQMEAAANALSVEDLFDRLERTAQLLRIDPAVRPKMFRGARISQTEVDMLRTIKDVVRSGRVRGIERDTVVLDGGAIDNTPNSLFVDCTAKALGGRPPVPVFEGNRITVQMVRAGLISRSAAVTAHVEAAYESNAEKNALCKPMTPADSDVDWLRLMLADLHAARVWSADEMLSKWVAEHRLWRSASAPSDGRSSGLEDMNRRISEARPRAEANLGRLLESHVGSTEAHRASVVAAGA